MPLPWISDSTCQQTKSRGRPTWPVGGLAIVCWILTNGVSIHHVDISAGTVALSTSWLCTSLSRPASLLFDPPPTMNPTNQHPIYAWLSNVQEGEPGKAFIMAISGNPLTNTQWNTGHHIRVQALLTKNLPTSSPLHTGCACVVHSAVPIIVLEERTTDGNPGTRPGKTGMSTKLPPRQQSVHRRRRDPDRSDSDQAENTP